MLEERLQAIYAASAEELKQQRDNIKALGPSTDELIVALDRLIVALELQVYLLDKITH